MQNEINRVTRQIAAFEAKAVSLRLNFPHRAVKYQAVAQALRDLNVVLSKDAINAALSS